MLIDSHCHILSQEYENKDEIIREAFTSGVSKIIINGYDINSSIEAVETANKYSNVYAAIGIGPENIDNLPLNYADMIKELANNKKVVAIGEIGLDYYWTKDNKDIQLEVFNNMLKIAKEFNLPVIVHSRSSIQDCFDNLKKYKLKGIMHCYSGSLQMAKEFIKLGFLIGISGVCTFKNSKEIKEVIKSIDIENISLETDSPYLSPEPFRGKKNKPSNVLIIAQKIAEIKNIDIEKVIEVTGLNVVSKFDL